MTCCEERGFWSFLKGLFIGAIAGIGIGMLTAPKPGHETREDIRAKASEMMDEGRNLYEAKREQFGEAIETGAAKIKDKTTEVSEKITTSTESIKTRLDEIGSKAHEKIDEAKKRFGDSETEKKPEA